MPFNTELLRKELDEIYDEVPDFAECVLYPLQRDEVYWYDYHSCFFGHIWRNTDEDLTTTYTRAGDFSESIRNRMLESGAYEGVTGYHDNAMTGPSMLTYIEEMGLAHPTELRDWLLAVLPEYIEQ
jgi:hypothetical protein